MKINSITQAPFGTILSLSDTLPSNSVGNYLSTDGEVLHKIKGTPSDLWSDVLIDKTTDVFVGQEVQVLKIV
ncbi:hypothetical protein ACQRDX_06085 [Streptococcus sp. SGI.013]|uniref:hypothetical protein n=1 Tax=unclassified Streptococcus TaxID=2608887 RepID=UPI003D0659DA